MQIPNQFKSAVVEALLAHRQNFGGSDAAFSKQISIHNSIFSRLKKGEIDGILSDTEFIRLGRYYDISTTNRKWIMARTQVFDAIENDVNFCKTNSKGMLLVDDCAIGKTFTGKHLSKVIKNCFYVDASQCKTKQNFIRTLAKSIGLDSTGKYVDVKNNIKYYINMLELPVFIIDELGDLEYPAFLELKELWNATEGRCGWYGMGADGLRAKIESGISSKRVGFREIFSRYSDKFMSIVPTERSEKISFYKQLITDVLTVNMEDKTKLPTLVKKCLISDADGTIGGLRRAETLLIMNQ